MAEFGLEDKKTYQLNFGSSFGPRKENAFHTIRYDFKPASVDTSKPSELAVGKSNDVTVVLPHIQESGSTTFKGSKRPCAKECVLIIDKNTGEVTLERINSTVQLKKIRSSSGTGTVNKPVSHSPITVSKLPPKPNPGKVKPTKPTVGDHAPNKTQSEVTKVTTVTPKPPSQHIPSKEISNVTADLKESGSDSSSSESDSDSDSDGDDGDLQEQGEALQSTLNQMVAEDKSQPFTSSLHEDLQLTESESDSD